MIRRGIDPDYIACELAWETPPQLIADHMGDTVMMLIHRLAILGRTDLSTRLAAAAQVKR